MRLLTSSFLSGNISWMTPVQWYPKIRRVQNLLIHLNSVEESIQFTCEMESNGCLPFLDVLMSRQPDGSIRTSVYRKGTHTDRYLDYNSNHPLSHKKSVASTLINRAHTHSSTTSSLNKEVKHVGSVLRMNGYPSQLTKDPGKASGRSQDPPTSDQTTRWKASTVIPYVRGVSESIRRILSPLGIRVCYKPFQTLKQTLSHPKDPVPDLQRRDVVYKIPCAACSSSYIGQTGRKLSQRLDEHRRAVRQADFNSSALAEHAWTCDHAIDWSNVKVLSNPRDYTTRMLEEAVFIRQTSDTLNRDCGSLPAEYENLLGKDGHLLTLPFLSILCSFLFY